MWSHSSHLMYSLFITVMRWMMNCICFNQHHVSSLKHDNHHRNFIASYSLIASFSSQHYSESLSSSNHHYLYHHHHHHHHVFNIIIIIIIIMYEIIWWLPMLSTFLIESTNPYSSYSMSSMIIVVYLSSHPSSCFVLVVD